MFPHVHVTLVDENATALAVARKRGDESGLTNVAFLQSDVRHVQEAFDVVIALHACGGATDAVLSAARQMGAAAIVVPCCVGGLVACRGGVTGLAGGEGLEGGLCGWDGRWDRAKSFLFRGLLEEGEYKTLARAADFGEGGGGDEWRFVAKSLVECDRMRWMEGEGYVTELVQMPRWTSPKNDVLIMWCGKEGEWRADEVANGFVRDVVEGSVLRGLGESEVAEVGELLKDVVAGGTGVYVTPRGVGKRRRKVVHGVAEGLGLAHESVGRGVDRVVVVRRSDIWPVFSDGYVGIGGAEIEKVCQQCVDVVPGNMVERKILRRGRPHHITLVGPTEMGRVGDARDCARAFYDGLRGTRFTVLGVGRVRKGMTGWDGVDVEDVEEAWFVVVDWPEAQAVRRSHGLPSADLHITLGFANKDVHQVRKGASTLVSPRRMESVLPIGI